MNIFFFTSLNMNVFGCAREPSHCEVSFDVLVDNKENDFCLCPLI